MIRPDPARREPTCACGHGPGVHTQSGKCRLRQAGVRNGVSWRGCGCKKWQAVPFQPDPCRCEACLQAVDRYRLAELTVEALVSLARALLVPAPRPVTAIDIPQQRGSSDVPARTRPGRA